MTSLDEFDSKLNAVATRKELAELREFVRASFAALASMLEGCEKR